MKTLKISLLGFFFLASLTLISQTSNLQHALSINNDGADPHDSAILDVQSTSQGMLVPRMTTLQREAILPLATGLFVFDTDTNSFWFFNGSTWNNLSTKGQLADADDDTMIQVEENADEDVIRFDAGGSERLQIMADSSSLNGDFTINDGSLLIDGTIGATPESGAGTRLMWIPAKSAFRAGVVAGTEWDDVNVGEASSVAGGNSNTASDENSFVGGGENNVASGLGSAVVGGTGNTASDFQSTVGGGNGNEASGSFSTVSGGDVNTASASYSAVGGGFSNEATDLYDTVGGGLNNTASGGQSFVAGGGSNTASGFNGFVGAGAVNMASGSGSVVGGGVANEASGANSFIGSGSNLLAESFGEAVVGLFNRDYTPNNPTGFDGDDRIFVVGNGTNTTNRSNALTIKKDGKTGIGRIPTTNTLEVAGAASKTGAGNWIANSDSRLKKNIEPLHAANMLQKLLSLQGITYEWNDHVTEYKRPEGIQYGFTAQNIQEIFPTLVEEDNLGFLQTAYGTYDAMTVEAIRALNEITQNQKSIIQNLLTENAGLAERMNRLEALIFHETVNTARQTKSTGED